MEMGTRALRRTLVVAALLAGTVAATPAAQAASPEEVAASSCTLAPSVGAWSAMTGASAAGARSGPREPSGWTNPPIDEAPVTKKPFRASIPVRFHIFTDGAKGRLSETTLKQQITVMNAGFGGREGAGADTGFTFTYAGVDYTDNASWFYDLDLGTSIERTAKAATHVGDARTLNVWTTDGPSYLGFATFPSYYKRAPQLDGVVLDYKSFPGGAYGSNYSLGKTATHEVGHWLGLLHTFQGACNAKGDYVEDTPSMATPTSGCPAGKDTCSAPGVDPIHNSMDYSFDSCYDQFSPGQAKRMLDQYAYFRAGGGTSVGQ